MVPAVSAQKLVTMALRKLGVLNRLDVINQDDLADGLDAMWALLDEWSNEMFMIPFLTHLSFDTEIVSSKRRYTIGSGADLNVERPVEIVEASWLDAGGSEWPIEIVGIKIYTGNNPYKETDVGRPTQLYYEPSFPAGQIFFSSYPQDGDTLLLKVKHAFSAEICACCDGDECTTGCVDADCSSGTVDPDDYTISVAGCAAGDDACVLSGQNQMEAYLATQCAPTCDTTFEQDFSYDDGGGAITITATAVRTVRTAPLPTQLALTKATEFPPGYQSCIMWNLALALAPEYNIDPPPANVTSMASKTKRTIKGRNSKPEELTMDAALTAPTDAFSVYSGWFRGSS